MDNFDQNATFLREPFLDDYPDKGYVIEIIKNGTVIDKIDICKHPFLLIGRMPECDIQLAHNSISRKHAIIQWRKVDDQTDPYVLDLESTHGTLLNKQLISANAYYKLDNGYRLSFGASSRHFVLTTPNNESINDFISTNITHTQMRSIYERLRNIAKKVKRRRIESDQQLMPDICDNSEVLQSESSVEKPYHNDPKGQLSKYFHRIGRDLHFNFEELPEKQFICSITLPVDDEFGKPIVVEIVDCGRKKQLIRKCALEACQILDDMDILDAESENCKILSRDERLAENDFYSSDEDSFFDRTGELEAKRRIRAQRYIDSGSKLEVDVQTVHTFQSSTDLVRRCIAEEKSLKVKLANAKMAEHAVDNNDLDEYIKSLQRGALGSRERAEIRFRLTRLHHEKSIALKLVKLSTNCSDDYKQWLTELEKLEKEVKEIDNCAEFNNTRKNIPENHKRCIAENKNNDESCHKQDIILSKKIPNERTVDGEKNSSTAVIQLDSCNNFQLNEEASSRLLCFNEEDAMNMFNEEDKFVEWQPPQDQKGDGRTILNDKYGY